jgi:uncharacterized damage-inducible protein DinB
MPTVIDLLLANLDEAYERKAWHGPNLRGSLRGLSVDEVKWRPGKGRHNIWELALHAAYWKYATRRRLGGGIKRGSFPLKGSNFFPVPPTADEESWHDTMLLLDVEHRQLRQTVASLTSRALENRKKLQMVYGIAAHDLYHTGQIQLIKRLYRG